MSDSKAGARTYNQTQLPRRYAPGKRRFSIYWTWSYPWEANRDVAEMDNRFSTITEVRRVAWPGYETPDYSEKMFLQGIAGTLELFLSPLCASSSSSVKPPPSRSQSSSASTRPDSDCPSTSASSPTPTPS